MRRNRHRQLLPPRRVITRINLLSEHEAWSAMSLRMAVEAGLPCEASRRCSGPPSMSARTPSAEETGIARERYPRTDGPRHLLPRAASRRRMLRGMEALIWRVAAESAGPDWTLLAISYFASAAVVIA